jgi:hypothetical protein
VHKYNAKWGLRVDALPRHLPVALLKNMQRHSLTREEHDV